MRNLFLVMVLAALFGAGAMLYAEPWMDAEGYALPAPSVEPQAPYLVSASATEVAIGDTWGVRVMPFYNRPLAEVRGELAGLPGVTVVTFYELDGDYVTLIPVSYSTRPATDFQLQLTITDHRGHQHATTVLLRVVAKQFPTQHMRATAQQTSLVTADRTAEDRAKVSAARAHPSPEPLWRGPLVMPLEGRLTTEFGLTRYVNGVLYGRHSGLDIAAPMGTPIVAAARGRVTFASSLWVSGDTVILDHGLGMFTAYNHMSKVTAAVGQMVEAGEVVGEVGSTGFSTGPHLHFTLWIGSVPTNPWPWFEQDPSVLLGP